MKIHLTGTVWHGNHSGYLKASFVKLGHEVLFFNEGGNRKLNFLKRVALRLSKKRYATDYYFRRRISQEWLDSIKTFKPDLIILEYSPEILPEFVRKARDFKKPLFYWVTSPPALQEAKDLVLSLAYVDKVFSIDRAWMSFLNHFAGNKEISHLPLAGADDIFYPLWDFEEKEKRAVHDVCFVGSCPPYYPSSFVRAYFIDKIPQRYTLAVYGSETDSTYWARYFPRFSKSSRAGHALDNKKINEIYNLSRIILNIHSVDHLKSISARTFEIALAGGFQIIDWREDLDKLLPAGLFPTFRTSQEMVELIDHWINKPKERYQQAIKSRESIKEKHIWQNRAQEILSYIK